jgi:hypothetical protein
MYKTIILLMILVWGETWSLTVREKQAEGGREQGAEEDI